MTSYPEAQISADRLEIREYRPQDQARVEEALNPEALPPGGPSQPGDIARWLADGVHAPRRAGVGVHLMMLDREADRIVGSISLFHTDWEVRSAEIGYGVRGEERGKGYATEALAAVSRWALSAGGIQRAWLTANTDNLASVRVAEKAGFTREGTLRRAALEDDGLHDQAVFSLLDDEA
ncbi:MAG TPA: GNAT family N-acetyltransferase [Trebonia sp.]|nr:GNAT family N-acetyltransferase [Trebonia sp.]